MLIQTKDGFYKVDSEETILKKNYFKSLKTVDEQIQFIAKELNLIEEK